MTGTTITIIVLVAVATIIMFILYKVAERMDVLAQTMREESTRIQKREIDIDARLDVMSDMYGRLREEIVDTGSDIHQLAEMTSDTHRKMLYAYNNYESAVYSWKHAKKATDEDSIISEKETLVEGSNEFTEGGEK